MEGRTLLSIAVTNPGDSGPGSLRQAIVDASDGDTINFSPNLSGATIKLTSGELQIGKSLDIEGLGPDALTIDGGGTGRVFDITTPGASVTIAGVTITDGVAPSGGGVMNDSGHLILSDVSFVSDQAAGGPFQESAGGALFSQDGTVEIRNSTFTDDLALGNPGLDASGGAISSSDVELNISASTFTDNLARGGDRPQIGFGAGDALGGAIDASVGTLTISGTTFNGIRALAGNGFFFAPGRGGAVEISTSGSPAVITGSPFDDNTARGGNAGPFGSFAKGGNADGGAISSLGNLTLASDSFAGNLADGGAGGSGGGSGGGARGGGVAVGADNSFTIGGSLFVGNEALGGSGGDGDANANGGPGGTAVGGGVFFNAAGNMIASGTFVGNTARGGEGGHGLNGGTGGNGLGGAILSMGTATVSASVLLANSASGGAGGDADQAAAGGNGGNGLGGAIGLQDDGLSDSVIGSLISLNIVQGGAGGSGGLGGNGEGGGLFVDATDTVALTADVVVLNQAFSADNNSLGIGGGVFLSSPGSTSSGTKIHANFASTADPEVHGSFSPGP
jgi:hypothetical protein